jgi:hypothetical protein
MVLYLGSREVTGRPDEELVKFQQRELIEKDKWDGKIQALIKPILHFLPILH